MKWSDVQDAIDKFLHFIGELFWGIIFIIGFCVLLGLISDVLK